MALVPRFKKQIINEKPFGREQYVSHFLNKFNNLSPDNFNIIHYHGIGGIGKTTLQKIISDQLTNEPFNISIFINFEEASNPEKFYSLVGNQLKRKMKMFYFEIAYAAYWSKLNPHISLAKLDVNPIEESSFLADALALVDGFGAAGMGASLISVINKYAKKINFIINSNYKDELDELTEMSASEIETMLPKFLSYDIDNHLKKHPNAKFIFQLDTHEFLWEKIKIESKRLEADVWIRDLILSLPSANTIFSITGRETLKWSLDDLEWNNVIEHKHLDSFSHDDSISFLTTSGVKEANIREIIAKESDGVPFYLKLSLETYHTLTSPKIEDFILGNNESIFNRFFHYIDKSESSLLKILSLTNDFDKTLFLKIVEHFNLPFSTMDFDYIVDYSFISKTGDKFSVHNLMKKSVENKIEEELKKEIYTFLFQHFNTLISNVFSVEDVSRDTFLNVTNAFFYKSKLFAENSVLKWYVENFEITLSQSDFINELKDLYLFIVNSVSKEYFKTKFLIKLGHIYLELGSVNKTENIIDLIENNDFSNNDKDWFELLKIKILEGKKFIKKDERNSIHKKYSKLALSDANKEVRIIAFTNAGNIKRQTSEYDEAFSLLVDGLNLISDTTPLNTKIDLYFKMAYYYKDISDENNFIKCTDLISSLANTNSKKSKYNKALLLRLISENHYKNERYDKALFEANEAHKMFAESVGETSSKTITSQYLIGRILFKIKKEPEIVIENRHILTSFFQLNRNLSLYNKLHELFSESTKDLIQIELIKFRIDKDISQLIELKDKLLRDTKYISTNLITLYKELIVAHIITKDSAYITLLAKELIDKLISAGQHTELSDFIKFINSNSLLKTDIILLNEYAINNTKSDSLKLEIEFEFILTLRNFQEYDMLSELISKSLYKYEEFGLYNKLWKCYDLLFNTIRYKDRQKATALMEEKISKMLRLDNKFFILEYSYRKILDLYSPIHDKNKRTKILEYIVALTLPVKASKPEQYYEPLVELIALYNKTNKDKFFSYTLDLLDFLLTQPDKGKEFKLHFYPVQKTLKGNTRFIEIEKKFYSRKKTW